MKRRIWIVVLFLFFAAVLFSAGAYAMSDRPDKAAVSAVDPRETRDIALAAIDRMIDSYSKRNAGEFIESVADDFTGERVMLDRAVRKDFSLYTDIDLRYTLDNVVSNSAGDMVSVTINFTRSHTVIQTTTRETKSGTTELIFKRFGKTLKLYSMKPPLVFGVSGL